MAAAQPSKRQVGLKPIVRVALCAVGVVGIQRGVTNGWTFVSSMRSGFRAAPATASNRGNVVRHAGGFTFDIETSEDHQGLVVQKTEDGTRVSTHGGYGRGWWNTVLGDADIPGTGKSYWEVKIVRKPNDAWEYIGVAESSSDVTVPLTRNKKGAGYFAGATMTESMMYRYMTIDTQKFQDEAYKSAKRRLKGTVRIAQEEPMKLKSQTGFWHERLEGPKQPYPPVPEKDVEEEVVRQSKLSWGVPGTHVGIEPNMLPPFKQGTTVGVEVDMDEGSLSFYSDGKKYGPVRDYTGKPLDLKGKKLRPAVSVFGRVMGPVKEFGVMELRSGLAPPS
eukprot:TRINITY_DN239_c0_g1_i1.p1 TRINITY_DN239_c0_g1~~TRINITY_DN239_c0_g1_i1.p1  ORF type:complete len:355 (+),score=74.79 TRINITY_DN239_c0_g1_i1:64-1065(+)